MKTLKIFAFLINSLLFSSLNANQIHEVKRLITNGDVFGSRGFIENKGQFDASVKTENKILYALENGEERIYFTNKGLVYKFVKNYPLTESQHEAIERGVKINSKPAKDYYVNMEWANSNPDIQIESSKKQNHYFTYGTKEYSGAF